MNIFSKDKKTQEIDLSKLPEKVFYAQDMPIFGYGIPMVLNPVTKQYEVFIKVPYYDSENNNMIEYWVSWQLPAAFFYYKEHKLMEEKEFNEHTFSEEIKITKIEELKELIKKIETL